MNELNEYGRQIDATITSVALTSVVVETSVSACFDIYRASGYKMPCWWLDIIVVTPNFKANSVQPTVYFDYADGLPYPQFLVSMTPTFGITPTATPTYERTNLAQHNQAASATPKAACATLIAITNKSTICTDLSTWTPIPPQSQN